MINLTKLDGFLEPLTPEQEALQKAMLEVKEEAGKLKTKLRKEVRSLSKKRAEELVPSVQVSLDEQIAKKQKEFADVDLLDLCPRNDHERALQNHVKGLIKWDGIMKKHGVTGY
jgi:hypothetical protein